MNIVITLFLVVLTTARNSVAIHNIKIYYTDGTQEELLEDTPIISGPPADKLCHTGVWMVHEPQYYGLLNSWILYRQEGDCFEPPAFQPGSARKVGVEGDPFKPSVTVFSKEHMAGDRLVIEDGIPKLDFPIESLVIIGPTMEVYLEENYGGEPFCWEHNSGSVHWLWIGHGWDLPFSTLSAKSLKVGCSSSTRRYSPNEFQRKDRAIRSTV